MKFNNKELWTIHWALHIVAGYCRASNNGKSAKIFEKLADKIEKELK